MFTMVGYATYYATWLWLIIPFITLIMVDDTVYKSLIMGYESLKYNFILKNMLKTAFGLS
jgi:hypothetical protein